MPASDTTFTIAPFYAKESSNVVWLVILKLKLGPKIQLLNFIDCDIDYLPLLTLIFTLTKKAVYQNKESKVQTSLCQIKQVVRKHEEIERNIAIAKKKIQLHNNKWLNIFNDSK